MRTSVRIIDPLGKTNDGLNSQVTFVENGYAVMSNPTRDPWRKPWRTGVYVADFETKQFAGGDELAEVDHTHAEFNQQHDAMVERVKAGEFDG